MKQLRQQTLHSFALWPHGSLRNSPTLRTESVASAAPICHRCGPGTRANKKDLR